MVEARSLTIFCEMSLLEARGLRGVEMISQRLHSCITLLCISSSSVGRLIMFLEITIKTDIRITPETSEIHIIIKCRN